MGHRGEISSVRFDVPDDRLTYFFNFKLNRSNDLFLNFVVSIRQEQGTHRPFRRHGIVVFEDQLPLFYQKMKEGLQALRQKEPYRVSFQTETGRAYEIFLRQRSGKNQLVCKETNHNSVSFGEDMVTVPNHLVAEFARALERSEQEWARLRGQEDRGRHEVDASSMERVKVKRVPKNGRESNAVFSSQ